MENCAQAETITDIKETLKSVAQAVNRIAAQDERMTAFDRKNAEQDTDINNIYERMGKVETMLGREGDGIRMKVIDSLGPFTVQMNRLERLLNIATSRTFVVVIVSLGLTVTAGALCDMMYHSAFLGMIFDWIMKVRKALP